VLRSLPQRGMSGPDRCFSFKNAVKELAHLHGYTATFMFSPTNVSWGLKHRSALIRIKGGTTESRHVRADDHATDWERNEYVEIY
jgi:glutamine synthetase